MAGSSNWEQENAALQRRIAELEKQLTQHQQTITTMRESEIHYRLLAEHTADVIWILDLNSRRFTYVSPSVERLRGYTVEQVLAQPLEQVMTPASAAMIHESLPKRIQAFLAGDTSAVTHTHQVEQTCKDGSTVWTEVVTTLTQSDAGLQVIGSSRNIAARKQAETALRQSNTLLTTVAEIQHALATTLNENSTYQILVHGIQQLFPDINHIFISRFDATRAVIQAVRVIVDGVPIDVTTLPELAYSPQGLGMQSRVIRTREPLVIHDHLKSNFKTNPIVRLGAEEQETQSAVYMPMLAQDQVLGLIQLQSYLPNRFTPEDVKALTLVANTAAAFIQDARLYFTAQQEIIERETATASLQKSEERYRRTLDEMLEGCQLIDFDWRYVYLNDVAIRQSHYSRAQIIGHTMMEVYPGIEQTKMFSVLRNCMEHRVAQQLENEFTFPDDSQGYFQLNIQPAPEGIFILSMDITERKLAEQISHQETERLRLALDAAHAGIWEWDLRTNKNVWSDELWRVYGLEPHNYEPSYETWRNTIHPDDRLQAEQAVQTAAKNATNLKAEWRVVDRDGSLRWLMSRGKPIFDAQGRVERFLGVVIDITERKLAEQALKKNERVLRLFVEHSPAAIAMFDRDMKYILTSRRFAQDFGLGNQDLAGRSHYEVFPEIPERWKAIHQRCLAGAIEKADQDLVPRAGGALEWVHWEIHPWYEETGTIGGIILFSEVITARIQAEQAIRASEERFRELANNIAEEFWVYDWEQLRITYVNPAYEKIWQRPVESLYQDSNSFFDTIFPADLPDLREAVARQATGQSISVEYRVVRPDGSLRWIWDRSYPVFDSAGKLIRTVGVIADISERKHAETLLAESENRYRQAIIAADAIPYALDYATRQYTFMGEGIEKLTGYSVNEFTPAQFASLHRQAVMQGQLKGIPVDRAVQMTLAGQGGAMWKCDFLIRTRTGEERWLADSAIQVLGENGLPVGSIGIIQDITERKETEKVLEARVKQATAQVQDLYDNAPAGYHSLDANGNILIINQTELNWLGYPRDELLGHPVSNLFTPASVQTFRKIFPVFMQLGSLNNLELEFVRRDGTVMPILVNALAIYDEHGNYVMSRSTILDNTERKKAEQALRESNDQNSLLFEESPDAVILFDELGHVVRMNHAAQVVTGYSSDQMVGHSWAEIGLLPRDQVAQLAASTLTTSTEVNPFTSIEFKLKRADAEFRDVSMRVFGVKIQGRQHYLSTMRDITTEKQAQETLRRANLELARAARAKDEFLANMSHELRTPLNAILGLTESLGEQLIGPLNERQISALQTIEASGRHLLTLINDILDLSKVESGNEELHITPVAVTSLCESSLIFIKQAAHKKQIRVTSTLDLAVEWVSADERRLKQMLVNLLSNAVKFTPAGGQIELTVAGDVANQTASFSVHDTGIGIDPEDLPRLFKSFVQLDGSLTRRYEGTGLGLALVARMAEMHGGSVHVASEPGKGSRFTIVLPWTETMQTFSANGPTDRDQPGTTVADTPAASSPEVDAHAPLILIAEDNESNIITLSTYLQTKGYRIVVAHNGSEAIQVARDHRPALILMDLQMPTMDGLEATRRLRAESHPQLAHVPIIALTALAMPGDREHSLAAGANEYMSKPVHIKSLVAIIQKFVSVQ